MGKLIIDEAMRSKLMGLNEQVDLYDETGRKLGHFLPADAYRELLETWVRASFSEEELKRTETETGGRPLAEIWKSLGRS
jgi:hypothetical protein